MACDAALRLSPRARGLGSRIFARSSSLFALASLSFMSFWMLAIALDSSLGLALLASTSALRGLDPGALAAPVASSAWCWVYIL